MSIHSKVQQQLAASQKHQDYNAFIHLTSKSALDRALELDSMEGKAGTLHGMTLAVKDNIEVAGMPMTGGTPLSATPDTDASVINKLRDAGTIFIGKTNLHELAIGTLGNNATYGSVGCALDLNSYAGGSSGGSATAVALHLCDAGIGTDTGGSIRIPASVNGIVGFKPTKGRYKTDGVIPLSYIRDVVGPMTRDVRTAALLDAVMAGEEVGVLNAREPSSIRLGIPTTHFWEELESYVEDVTTKAKGRLQDAGVVFIPVDVSGIMSEIARSNFRGTEEYKLLLPRVLAMLHFSGSAAEFVEEIASPDVKSLVEKRLSDESGPESLVYQEAVAVIRPTVQHMYYDLYYGHNLDGLFFPATRVAAQRKTKYNPVLRNRVYTANTNPASFAGLPSIVVPAGPGARVGVEIDGRYRRDRELLEVGLAIEQILVGQ